jgi:secondary thiamine-phosphate synthase enzyme
MLTFHSTRLERTTTASFSCHDISADLQAFVDGTGIRNGLLVAAGQHTTTALVVNEAEDRLLGDIERHFLALTPPERAYAHNDLHLRPGIPADEPRNAHAHLIGLLGLGRYQAVLLVELDGPRQRQVLLQLCGV